MPDRDKPVTLFHLWPWLLHNFGLAIFAVGLVVLIAGPTLPTWADLMVTGALLAAFGWLARDLVEEPAE